MRKRLLSTLLLLLCCCLPVGAQTVSDAAHNVTLALPDDYRVVTADTLDDQADYLETLGHSVDSFRQYFRQDGLLFFAASPDRARQVELRCLQTEFAEQVGDLSLLDEATAARMADSLIAADTRAGWKLIEQDGLRFYEISTATSDSGGRFCALQYVTVRNGLLYDLTCYSAGETLTEADRTAAASLLAGLSIPKQSGSFSLFDAESIFLTVLIWAAILAALAAAGFLLYTFYADLRRRKNENEVSEYVRIKRRKF